MDIDFPVGRIRVGYLIMGSNPIDGARNGQLSVRHMVVTA